MKNLINQSLEIAMKALQEQTDKDLQFTRSLEFITFITGLQEKEGIKDVITKEVEVIKEVPVEIIKEVEVVKEVPVEVIKKVEVIKEVPVEDTALCNQLKARIQELEGKLKALTEKAATPTQVPPAPSEKELAASKIKEDKRNLPTLPSKADEFEDLPLSTEETPVHAVPKKESPRPVITIGSHYFKEAKLAGYIYQAKVSGKVVFQNYSIQPIENWDELNDAHYMTYKGALAAIKEAEKAGFTKVKLLSTTGLRLNKMQTPAALEYASYAQDKGINVFAETILDPKYDKAAVTLICNQILENSKKNKGGDSEDAPF